MKKALILGHYGVVNWGDEAILLGILTSLKNKNLSKVDSLFLEEISPTVVSANPKWTSLEYSCESVLPPPFGLRSFLKTSSYRFWGILKKSDFVIIGGGGLFQPNPWIAFWIWGYYLSLVIFFQKPVFILGNSFEKPIKETIVVFFIRWLFSKVQKFTVREKESFYILKDFWKISESKISIVQDFAYSIEIPSSSSSPQKKIGCMMREGDLTIAQEKIIIEGIQKKFPNYKIQTIVMQSVQAGDEGFAIRNGFSVFSPSKFSELLKEIASCEYIISSRLHGNILADILKVPFIPIAPRGKIKNLFGEKAILPSEITENIWKAKLEILGIER